MKKAISSVGDIVFLLALEAAVIFCSAGQYDGSNDDMIIALNQVSDIMD